MGIFKITLTLREGHPPYPTKTQVVFREFAGGDIDAVWHKLELKCQEKWGRDLKGFDCVMVSKRSGEYKAFLMQNEKKPPSPSLQVVPDRPRFSGHVHPFAHQEQQKPKH